MLKSLELEDFRCYNSTQIEFGSRLTFIAGPNAAGKSSLLDAIALLLAGANHRTSDSGQGIGDQVRDGQKGFTLRGTLSLGGEKEIGVERKAYRASTPQRFTVGGCQQSSKDANQEFLYNLLGVTPEVLKALTDSRTILSRPPNQQLTYLFRATGIAEIVPTEFLVKQRIKTISSPGHLEALIKEHKTVNLRDLNRERDQLKAKGQDHPAEAPKNPLEEERYAKAVARGAKTPQDARNLLQSVQEELAALQADKAVISGKLSETVEALQNPAKKTDPKGIIPEDKYLEFRDQTIPKYTENLQRTTKQCRELTNKAATLAQDKANLQAAIASVQAHIETLEQAKNLDTCPTCDRKWPAAKQKQTQKRLDELKETLTASQENLKLLGSQITDIEASWKATEGSRKFNEDGLREMGQQVTAYEAYHQGAQGRTPAEHEFVKSGYEKQLTMLDEKIGVKQQAVANWTKLCDEIAQWEGATRVSGQAKGKRDARLKELMQQEIPRENQVIEELEGIRTNLIEKHLEPFEVKLNKVLEELGQPPATYHLENGWMCAGRKAEYLSGGQTDTFFEFAFKLSVAETVGFPLVLLDNLAPIDEMVQGKLLVAAHKSGQQVVLVYTTVKRDLVEQKFAKAGPDVAAYWVSMTDGVSSVEMIKAKEKAA